MTVRLLVDSPTSVRAVAHLRWLEWGREVLGVAGLDTADFYRLCGWTLQETFKTNDGQEMGVLNKQLRPLGSA